jgi:hypothetical protein
VSLNRLFYFLALVIGLRFFHLSHFAPIGCFFMFSITLDSRHHGSKKLAGISGNLKSVNLVGDAGTAMMLLSAAKARPKDVFNRMSSDEINFKLGDSHYHW